MPRPVDALTIEGFQSGFERIDDVGLHFWYGGSPDGPPVLLWHGFMETSYCWRHVAAMLAQAGCCVLIPDMRGYGDSDKPEGEAGYDARSLAEEFRALVARLGFGKGLRLTIAAHDMGAPAALLWAADHSAEIGTLLYIDEPVLIGDVVRALVAYTPEATRFGSLFWWLLPYAPGAAEKIIVGNERGWLEWFHEFGRSTISPGTLDEYHRTFRGNEGVLGALGVYRAGFRSIEQTEPLIANKIRVPVIAVGGKAGLGEHVGAMMALVAADVQSVVIEDCGHFAPEDRPDEIARLILSAVTN